MKRISVAVLMVVCFCISVYANAAGNLPTVPFSIHPITNGDYTTFVKVFGEMRGPLRSAILADSKTNFENADPLAYVTKVKDTRDVKKALKNASVTWEKFSDIMANLLLGYFSIQPEKTKVGLIKQLADYGLVMNMEQVPEQYRESITAALKTDQGAALAGSILDLVVQIPPESVAIAKEHQGDLDRMFYTKHWKDQL